MGITRKIVKQALKSALGSVANFVSSYGRIILSAGMLLVAVWTVYKVVNYVQEAEQAKAERTQYRQDLKDAWAQTRKESLALKQCTEVNLQNFLSARKSEEAARAANDRALVIEREADKSIEVINREADTFLEGDPSCESITPGWIDSFVGWMRERP